jgi:hypothetical protein
VMGEAVEQGGGHFGVVEHGGPFAEGQVGGDNDGGLLVETANQVEQQLPAWGCPVSVDGLLAFGLEQNPINLAHSLSP